MLHRPLFLALFGVAALHPLAADTSATETFNGLLDRSPFGTPESKTDEGAAADHPLEFRGILEEKDGMIFSFYEKTSRRSTWVESNNPADGISIRSYDAATLTITVVYQEKNLTLPLKGGAAGARSAPAIPTRAITATPTRDASYHDQPFRIGHVAEETAIRRAVRQPVVARPSAPVSTQR